jgi:hypothetical protein
LQGSDTSLRRSLRNGVAFVSVNRYAFNVDGLAPSTFRRSPGAPVHSITSSAAEAAVEPAAEAAEAEEEEVVAVVAARVAPSAASCWRQSAWNC